MSDLTRPPVIFVTGVAVQGFLNGVVNIAFTTANFLPAALVEGDPENGGVVIDEQLSANLRMDLHCAQLVRDALDTIIEQNTKAKPASEVN